MKEGETFQPVKHIATVKGKARHLLLGERVALNILARCSGIATKCGPTTIFEMGYGFIRDRTDLEGSATSPEGTVTQELSLEPERRPQAGTWNPYRCGLDLSPITGFRLVEKYGMLVGGIDAHRNDLSSMIMLKDNHIWSAGASRSHQTTYWLPKTAPAIGSITTAIKNARRVGGFTLLLEVEVQSEAEADEAIDAGADIVMLDNMDGGQLADVSKRLKEKWSGKRRFLFESSGNITENNLQERAIEGEAVISLSCLPPLLTSFYVGIDILSTSAVHQSVQHIDFSLKIQKSN